MVDKVPSPIAAADAAREAASNSADPSTAHITAKRLTRWQKFRLVGLVVLKRVRFIAVLAGIGLFICEWDAVMNYWEKWTQPQTADARQLEQGHEFYCPMDPQVVRSTYEPNGDVPKCPICGMPLSVRRKGEAAKLPVGVTGRVQLSPERIQLAGIKTVPAEYRPMAKQTQTVGFIAFDESRRSRVVSRVGGYVEKLYVDTTFAVVRKGDPLAEIYSPELYSTATELLLASRSGGAPNLVAAARERLLLMGVDPQEIDGIVTSGKPSTRLVMRSPQTGYVVEKKIVAGSSVEARMTLLEIADLSTVWVEAEVYEKDIPFLQVGQKVETTVEAYPNRTFAGKLALVYPQLEVATRTNRIRLELENPGHELRPGMFATVRINTPLESIEPYKGLAASCGRMVSAGPDAEGKPPAFEFLVVPERAVVDTGSKKVVYVEREPGMFEGVEVVLGPRMDGAYPVISGLNPGDLVAAAGGFLIDAETRLNPAAASTYFGATGSPQSRQPNSASISQPRQGATTAADPSKPSANAPRAEPKVVVATLAEDDLKNVNQLPEEDRKMALAQRICPVSDEALGSMGVPVKITLRGQPVFLCCEGCMGSAKRSPDEMLKKIASVKSTNP